MAHLVTLLLVLIPIIAVFAPILSDERARAKVSRYINEIFESYE